MKIVLVSDYLIEDYKGGEEYADVAFIEELKKNDVEVFRMRTREFNKWALKNELENENIIFCNFSFLEKPAMDKVISSKCKYIVYEYDHKYLKLRDSARYPGNLSPPDQIINRPFYKNALRVFPQTLEHARVIFRHLNIKNLTPVHGSMWSDEEFDHLRWCFENVKKENFDDYLIIDNEVPNKGMFESIELAQKQGWSYKLLKNNRPYKEFIQEMAKYSKFIFTPRCFEACSRIALEERILLQGQQGDQAE